MRHLPTVVLVLAGLCSTGCGAAVTSEPSVTTTSDGLASEGSPGSAAAQRGNALVRFVNADLQVASADVISSDRKIFSGVAAKGVTGYLEIPRGRVQFALRDAGGADELATVGNRELIPGRHYTLVALPRRNGGARLAILNDWLGLIEPGQTRVRLINGTTDVGDLDLYMAGTTSHVLHGLDVGSTAISSFADMDAGIVEIRTPGQRAPTLFAKLSVEPNRFHTLVVVGGTGSLDLIQIADRIEP